MWPVGRTLAFPSLLFTWIKTDHSDDLACWQKLTKLSKSLPSPSSHFLRVWMICTTLKLLIWSDPAWVSEGGTWEQFLPLPALNLNDAQTLTNTLDALFGCTNTNTTLACLELERCTQLTNTYIQMQPEALSEGRTWQHNSCPSLEFERCTKSKSKDPS